MKKINKSEQTYHVDSSFDHNVASSIISFFNKNLANRSRVSCAHNTLRASVDLNITP